MTRYIRCVEPKEYWAARWIDCRNCGARNMLRIFKAVPDACQLCNARFLT